VKHLKNHNQAMEEKRHLLLKVKICGFFLMRAKPKPLAWFKNIYLALSDCSGMCNLCKEPLRTNCLTNKTKKNVNDN